MTKFNRAGTTTSSGFGPIRSRQSPTGLTHEGAPGYRHEIKSELFLLAVSNMVGEDTFYESADVRDDRYAALAREVAVADPGWTAAFLGWLRSEGALAAAYHMHDGVFVISDMQTMTADTSAAVPANIPLYGFNLGGYRHTAYPSGPNRHEFGGLTDTTFRMIPLIEAGRRGDWPWV